MPIGLRGVLKLIGASSGIRRRQPGLDRHAPEFLRSNVLHRLTELPAMTSDVLDGAFTLAVHLRRRRFQHPRAVSSGPFELSINIVDAHLDDVAGGAFTWWLLVAADVGDDDRATLADAHLSPMAVADSDPLLEAKCLREPGHRRPHMGVDEDGDHRGRRDGTVLLHESAPRISRAAKHVPVVLAHAPAQPVLDPAEREGICVANVTTAVIQVAGTHPPFVRRDDHAVIRHVVEPVMPPYEPEAFMLQLEANPRLTFECALTHPTAVM